MIDRYLKDTYLDESMHRIERRADSIYLYQLTINLAFVPNDAVNEHFSERQNTCHLLLILLVFTLVNVFMFL